MDVLVAWDTLSYRGDWTVAAGALGVDPGIESAVLLSLFTDRRASPDFTPNDGTDDRRGWWGDTYESVLLGSRLWQLNRAKKSDAGAMLLQVRDYCREALQWLVDSGVAASVSVSTSWLGGSGQVVGIMVAVAQPGGTVTRRQYQWAWGGTRFVALPAAQPLSLPGRLAPVAPPAPTVAGQFVVGQSSLGSGDYLG